MKKRGFSLVEMLVVLGIIALLSAILLPIFKGLRESVYKHQCISNLQKLYHAIKMYYLDTGTYPENRITLSDGRQMDLGLLSLHSPQLVGLVVAGLEHQPVDPQLAKSIISRKGIYPVFANEFHCPANIQHPEPLIEAGGSYFIDPLYFNYNSFDPQLGILTYERVRTPNQADPNFNKQLYAKEPLSSTVITWCWTHREFNPDGTPKFGSKDIVLFLDGHTEVRETIELFDPISGGWLLQPRRR